MGQIVGDLLNLGAKWQIIAGANLKGKSLVDLAGTLPADAAECTGGVVDADTPSGELADIKLLNGQILSVYATDTVTAGLKVEVYNLASTIYGNINGTKTLITVAGVKNISSGYAIGRALTGGSAGQLVLVQLHTNQAKS
jgi:hypothetical protein